MTTFPGRKNFPDWLKDIGAKINYVAVDIDDIKDTSPVPDFDDKIMLQAHLDFIKNLGILYDGHPEIDHIDLGSIGWWGEWHLSGSDAQSCGDARNWVKRRWSLRFIFNYGLALHGSVLNNKSAILPEGEEVREEITRFLKRLGYRFVLKELNHPLELKAGRMLELDLSLAIV